MFCFSQGRRILDLYVVRWEIEVYFRDCKMKLAVDKYQIRSANGIKHFWLIASLAYMIACFESKRYNFSEGYHLLSQTIRREQISFIFDYFGEYCLTTFVHFHENGVGMLIYSIDYTSSSFPRSQITLTASLFSSGHPVVLYTLNAATRELINL